ncbi:MAG: glycosyltransferase family 39 protein [Gemmatimonadota bacterium]
MAAARKDGWLLAALALGLGLRLVELQGPLIDEQAWRQTDTAALARNFHEGGYRLLYPQVDWRGAGPGYAETNFPLYAYLVALLYGACGGPHEWLGRLLAAVLSTGCGLLLYLLLRRLYPDPWVARAGTFIYLVTPMSWFFGRAFMPEAAMLFLSVGALLSFCRWLGTGRAADLALAAAAAALCYLVKIPTLYLGFPLLYLSWSRWGLRLFRRPALWLYAALSLAPAGLWYAHAAGLFRQTGLTFGIWGSAGYDKWSHGLLLTPDYYLLMLQRLGCCVLTPAGLALMVLGAWWWWPRARAGETERGPGDHLLLAWLGGLVLYLLLVPEGNRKLHYYQLPFAPVGAGLAALPLAALLGGLRPRRGRRLWGAFERLCPGTRRLLAAALLVAVAASSGWTVRQYYRPGNNVYHYYESCLAAGCRLDARLPADALLVVGDLDDNAGAPFRAQSPSLLYYCHRKGWQITPDQFRGGVLDSLAALGATHFVSAAAFARAEPAFWRDLLARGVSTPATYPSTARTEGQYLASVRSQQGGERNFVVVSLRP